MYGGLGNESVGKSMGQMVGREEGRVEWDIVSLLMPGHGVCPGIIVVLGMYAMRAMYV